MFNNNVNLIGRLFSDAHLFDNNKVAKFNLAVDSGSSNANAKPNSIDVTVFGKPSFINTLFGANGFIKKGTLIAVQGHISSGSYTNKAGQRVFSTSVVAEQVRSLQPKSATANN